MYIPMWGLILLFALVAFVFYRAGAQAVRVAWRKSEAARRERRRLGKEDKAQEAASQRIRERYGEDLDDEAVMMIHDIEHDPYISEDNKRLAIGMEIVENHRRQKSKQQERQ